MNIFVVKYHGSFGFIKPWTAVRDSDTFSQQFLTPSIIEGMRQKLGVSKIIRHKVRYSGISLQQEKTQTRGWENKKTQKSYVRHQSILNRGILINPILLLAFENKSDAEIACCQHICFCRNEDLLLPSEDIFEMNESEFDNEKGFELKFERSENSFLVGYNRFNDNEPMYGYIDIK